MRVAVEAELLSWARERSGVSAPALQKKFPKFDEWAQGTIRPTLKQLERFAKTTHTPIGYFFLSKPPEDCVPIPDFRTVGNARIGAPSPDLLDTVFVCQQRQEWYRDYARTVGNKPLAFVGSVSVSTAIKSTGARIRTALGFNLDERQQLPTWSAALRRFVEQADALGVLVMVNGVVGSNNRRKLDPDEFRGFALSDGLAPLVFINGADTKAAQMFTLAHELAHVWLGESALSDVGPITAPSNRVEKWCNRVAAELLVPLKVVEQEYRQDAELGAEVNRLARRFKVSTLVILRRIHDAGGITQDQLWQAYREELQRLRSIPKASGGDFYLTTTARVGKRFTRAIVASTLEGQTLYRDAFRMLGFSKIATFQELGRSLGLV